MHHPKEQDFSKQSVAAHVSRARREAGTSPRLLGYDVNGIQEYVTANSRPLAMRGASEIISEFDRAQAANALFAGGGRGLFLVSEERAAELSRSLPESFAKSTIAGVLALGSVPWSDARPSSSLRWLKLQLHNEKDAAQRPADRLPPDEQRRCARCRMYVAERESKVSEEESEMVCTRCDTITEKGRHTAHRAGQRGSLVDLVAADEGYVAAVSADGNNMGALFDSLDSLERVVSVSIGVKVIFKAAHEAALAACGAERYIAPITGGDDIRVFFGPTFVERYVITLATQVAVQAQSIAPQLDLNRTQSEAFKKMGVGIGVVCASKTSSATSMLQRAHELERSAKARCLRDKVQSAIDFRWMSTSGLFLDGSSQRSSTKDRRPFALQQPGWDQFVKEVRALGELPTSQRAVLSERTQLDPAEFANLFRYQVARSHKWQGWYEAIGQDWKDANVVIQHCPDASHIEFLRMVGGAR